ncbi:MAG: thioredoxin domain-containing protein [Micrococcales bacterium]
MTPEPKLTRSEQRESAREKARQIREQNKRRNKTRKLISVTSIVAVTAAILGFGAYAIVSGIQNQAQIPNGGTPANFSFDDGIKVGAGLKGFTNDFTPTPEPSASIDPAAVPNIIMYVDYQCPVCQAFEVANAQQIRSWVDTGAATVEIHPISFLDSNSLNAYSSRAANAAICVGSYEPDKYFDFSAYLFDNQPAEGSAGPKDSTLVQAAQSSGVTDKAVESCITNKYFGNWLEKATTAAMTTNIPGTEEPVKGTPTVIVNGIKYTWNSGEELTSPARFAQFVQQAMGQ